MTRAQCVQNHVVNLRLRCEQDRVGTSQSALVRGRGRLGSLGERLRHRLAVLVVEPEDGPVDVGHRRLGERALVELRAGRAAV